MAVMKFRATCIANLSCLLPLKRGSKNIRDFVGFAALYPHYGSVLSMVGFAALYPHYGSLLSMVGFAAF